MKALSQSSAHISTEMLGYFGTANQALIWLILVFLVWSCFTAKAAVPNCWILLDFLGFSRQNLDFSIGYTGFSLK
jgi:hypothetical protein